jgi:cell division protein FtsI (penicillin-binding protein 3)
MAIAELKKNRLIFVYFVIIAIFAAIILRLFFLAAFSDKVNISFIYDLNKINKRGNIIDRNNVLVATDLKTKSLYISNVLVKDKSLIAKGLSAIFPDLTYQEIIRKVSDRKSHNRAHKGWVLIRRNVTPAQEERVQNLKMAGLLFEDDSIRVYPQ